jgi:hypothetical protein
MVLLECPLPPYPGGLSCLSVWADEERSHACVAVCGTAARPDLVCPSDGCCSSEGLILRVDASGCGACGLVLEAAARVHVLCTSTCVAVAVGKLMSLKFCRILRALVRIDGVDECIEVALEHASPCVFISDSGGVRCGAPSPLGAECAHADNPTAGGVGDVPAVLEALLRNRRVKSAVYASLPDAVAVSMCADAGIGKFLVRGVIGSANVQVLTTAGGTVKVKLGGKMDDRNWNVGPLEGELHNRDVIMVVLLTLVKLLVHGTVTCVFDGETQFGRQVRFEERHCAMMT